MRSLRKRFILAGLAVLVLLTVAFFLRFPFGPRPECHRAVDGALQQYLLESGNTNTYPNIGGHEGESFAMIRRYLAGGLQQYGYVPGLRADDPKDLVLMYMKVKTRYSWHGDLKPNIFSPRWWVVLPPSWEPGGPGNTCIEGGQLLDTAEFKARLENTLAFLKANQRPYWQTVAAEQTVFLKSLKD